MKALRYLPLVYVIGIHGFVFFAPYVALIMMAGYMLKRFKPRLLRTEPVPVRA